MRIVYFPSMSVRVDLPESTTSTPASISGSPDDLSRITPLIVPSCSPPDAASCARATNDQARQTSTTTATPREPITPPYGAVDVPCPPADGAPVYDTDRCSDVTERRKAATRRL